jgi:tetratricopeptide (TPR) repeat protein
MDIEEIRKFVLQNNFEKAIELLNGQILAKPDDVNALQLRGHIFYKMQRWGDAMNDFTSVLEIEPDNAEAMSKLELARNILGYFTPDMFNP